VPKRCSMFKNSYSGRWMRTMVRLSSEVSDAHE